jgi:hypothetical protein
MPDLTLDVLRQVALAGGVFDQDHLTDADYPALAVAGGYLHPGIEIDDVLPARRGMPIDVVFGLGFAEDDPGSRLESLLPRRSSTHSTSMSWKFDWPLASV